MIVVPPLAAVPPVSPLLPKFTIDPAMKPVPVSVMFTAWPATAVVGLMDERVGDRIRLARNREHKIRGRAAARSRIRDGHVGWSNGCDVARQNRSRKLRRAHESSGLRIAVEFHDGGGHKARAVHGEGKARASCRGSRSGSARQSLGLDC